MNQLDNTLLFDRVRVGVSVQPISAGKSKLKLDFYTRFPANLKTLAVGVTLFFSIFFLAILLMGNLAAVKDKPAFFFELLIYFLKFMLTFPFLAILTYMAEMANRYSARKFIKRNVQDLWMVMSCPKWSNFRHRDISPSKGDMIGQLYISLWQFWQWSL